MTFFPLPAHIHLSSSHLCAETMTVRVACGAQCPGGSNSKRETSRGALWALASQGVPHCFASIPPPHLRLCSPRSGHKVLSYSHQTLWLEAAADVTVFFFCLVLSPCSVLFPLPWILSVLAARVLGVCVFKKLKKRGL